MMKLISPTLNIEQEANEKLVQEVIEKLPDKDDPICNSCENRIIIYSNIMDQRRVYY